MKYSTNVYALKLNLWPVFFFVAHVLRCIKSLQHNIPLSLKLWCLVEARSCLEGGREGATASSVMEYSVFSYPTCACHRVFCSLCQHNSFQLFAIMLTKSYLSIMAVYTIQLRVCQHFITHKLVPAVIWWGNTRQNLWPVFFFVAHVLRCIKSLQHNIPLSLKLWCLVEARSCLEGGREGATASSVMEYSVFSYPTCACHRVFCSLCQHNSFQLFAIMLTKSYLSIMAVYTIQLRVCQHFITHKLVPAVIWWGNTRHMMPGQAFTQKLIQGGAK